MESCSHVLMKNKETLLVVKSELFLRKLEIICSSVCVTCLSNFSEETSC